MTEGNDNLKALYTHLAQRYTAQVQYQEALQTAEDEHQARLDEIAAACDTAIHAAEAQYKQVESAAQSRNAVRVRATWEERGYVAQVLKDHAHTPDAARADNASVAIDASKPPAEILKDLHNHVRYLSGWITVAWEQLLHMRAQRKRRTQFALITGVVMAVVFLLTFALSERGARKY